MQSKRPIKKGRRRQRRFGKLLSAAIAVVLVAAMGAGLFLNSGMQVSAAGNVSAHTSDASTKDSYEDIINENSVGRVWTDKSVTSNEDGTAEVSMSALSSAASGINTTTSRKPLDIVLVLDVSGSMEDDLVGEATTYEEVYTINQNETYYIRIYNQWRKVSYSNGGYGQQAGWYYYTLMGRRQYVTPMDNENDYENTQFYERHVEESVSKMEALQNAVTQFISDMNEKNAGLSEEQQSRIALVKFAGPRFYQERYGGAKIDQIGDDLYQDGRWRYNYTQVVSDFTSDASALTSAVEGLDPAGATAADYGFTLANHVLQGTGNLDGARNDVQKVVIFFTDGEPNHGNDFDGTVANDAIEEAATLKSNNTLVYSIGVFEDADPSDTENRFNAYMHGVSSNYPNAMSYTNLGRRAEDSNYYLAASSSDELANVFEQISEDITRTEATSPIAVAGSVSGDSNDGYLIFTDTLGDYMEVKSVTSIEYNGQTYNNVSIQIAGDGTVTYTFAANVSGNAVLSGDHNLNEIQITVQKSSTLRTGDVVTVKIPAALVPLDVYHFTTVNGEQSVETLVDAVPVSLNYTVGVKEAVLDNGYVDLTKIDSNYSGISDDGSSVDFLTNKWDSGSNGTTTAVFTPATDNGYYGDGYEASQDTVAKSDNATETADNVSAVTKSDSGIVTENLGNNGKITYDTLDPVTLSEETENALQVTKVVQGGNAQSEFDFTLTLTSGNAAYVEGLGVNNSLSASTKTLEETQSEETVAFGAITFKAAGTYTFKVAETTQQPDPANGWTYDNSEKEITVVVSAGQNGQLTAVVTGNNPKIVNKYETSSITLSEENENALKVQKTVIGAPTTTDFGFTAAFDVEASGRADEPGSINGIQGATGNSFTLNANVSADFEENDAAKTASFGEVTFTAPGTYIFRVTENAPAADEGWTFDSTTKTITVVVTDNNQGSLVAEVTYSNNVEGAADADKNVTDAAAFTNSYKADSVTIGGESGNAGIDVKKTLKDRAWQEGDSFTFTLTASEGTPMPEGEGGNSAVIGYEDSSKTASFGAITYDTEGVYTYTVAEVVPEVGAIGGITYDAHQVVVTVTVTDEEHDGQLEAQVTYDNSEAVTDEDKAEENTAAFTNTYSTTGATEVVDTAEFELKKQFTGTAWDDSFSFEFTITPKDSAPLPVDAEGNAIRSITVSGPDVANGTEAALDFGTITYNQAGTYEYDITETKGSNTGVTYDPRTVTVTVDVRDDLHGGFIHTVNYSDDKIFKNTYGTSVDYAAKGGLNIVKNLTGHDIAEEQFEFTVIPVNQESADKAGMAMEGVTFKSDAARMGANRVAQNIKPVFSSSNNLLFDQNDDGKEYSYKITESKGGDTSSGYTNDDTEYTITIAVSDNKAGTLTVTTTVSADGKDDQVYTYTNGTNEQETAQVVFNNSYNAEGTLGGDGEGAVSISATKEFVNGVMTGDEFKFNVLDANEDIVTTGTNAADGTITFGGVDYATAKLIADSTGDHPTASYDPATNTYSYQYRVVEDTEKLPGGVTANVTSFTITVNVKDNNNGTLTISVVYPENSNDNLAFKNTYGTVEDGSATINVAGTKVYNAESGLNKPDITEKYTFTLEGSEGAPMPDTTTTSNDAAGNITFGDITYTIENVFGTDSTEDTEEPENPGDGDETMITKFTCTCGHTDTNETAFLEHMAWHKLNGEDHSFRVDKVEVSETPVTEPEEPATEPETPVTEPEEPATEPETPVAEPEEPATEPETPDAESDGTQPDAETETSGAVVTSVDDITVKAGKSGDGNTRRSKTFTYTITESGSVEGVDNDPTAVRSFTVTVYDNGDGTVEAVCSVASGPKFTFTNTYSVDPEESTPTGEGGITLTKVLEGRELKEGEFTFQMKDVNGDVVSTGTNDANGNVELGSIEFTTPGTYSYTISEVNGGLGGVEYDTKVYYADAVVEDNQNGTLSVTWEVKDKTDGEALSEATFTNTYKASATKVTLAASKTLSGRTLKAGEFIFLLKDSNGNVVSKAVNSETGAIQFADLSFDTPGSYTYTISEEKGNAENVTYDSTVYTVTIHVADSGKGYLTASIDNGGKAIAFTNTYKEPEKDTSDGGSSSGSGGSSSPAPVQAVQSAQTGDSSPIALFVGIIAVSLLAIAAALAVYFRKSRQR